MEQEPFEFHAVVLGELASKSNQRRVVRYGPRMAVIKSDKAILYTQGFMMQVGRPPKAYEGRVALYAIVYYASERPDLDIALLQDCLQAAGVIKNDRQVREIHAWHKIDRERPRVEVSVRSLKPTPKEESTNV